MTPITSDKTNLIALRGAIKTKLIAEISDRARNNFNTVTSYHKTVIYCTNIIFNYQNITVAGASDDPCSETFAGPFTVSEPEIKHVQDYVSSLPDDYVKIYISLHSYGQYLLSPWGHTDEEFPDNYDDMMGAAKGFADALYRRYQTVFTYGSSSTTLCK